jgi:prephenate dehydrogenase
LSFAAALGAVPFFVDAAEADGVAALAESLPALLGASLMRVALHRSGWNEVERLAGAPFARLVLQGAEATAKEVSGLVSLNRVNILSKLDALQLELGELRQTIAEGEDHQLEQRIRSANASLQAWLAARQHGDWGRAESAAAQPPRQGPFDRLFGFRPPTLPRP